MTDNTDFADLAAEAAEADTGPTEEQSKRMTSLAMQLVAAESGVKDAEDALEDAKELRKTLRHETVPEYMAEIGQDVVGLPELNVNVVSSPYYHANIASDWEPEQREAAFDHLAELGHGDVVKVRVTYAFGKDEMEMALALVEAIKETSKKLGLEGVPDAEVEKGVAWNTLTALVKEQMELGAEDLRLDLLGATVGTIAKVKKRD